MLILAGIYSSILGNRIKGRKGLKHLLGGVFLKHNVIKNKGKDNKLVIEKGGRIYGCKFTFFGDHNCIHIAHDCVCKNMEFVVSGGGNISIGNHSHFVGNIHLACTEGKSIFIGERCLFSSEVTFRTGDSHSVLDSSGNRINFARDIYVGNHVWIGQYVVVLKGAHIGDDSIIGTKALITGESFGKNTAIAGIPAKVIKTDVNWYHELLEV
jgi:acetyltransferase-like isoleucine patch superfamily enzyme